MKDYDSHCGNDAAIRYLPRAIRNRVDREPNDTFTVGLLYKNTN